MLNFRPEVNSILIHFGSRFRTKTGPLRGSVLSEDTRNSNGFELFCPPKVLRFGSLSGANFGPIFGSILAPLWGRFGASPNPPFCLVFGLAWPAPGAEAKEILPDPS